MLRDTVDLYTKLSGNDGEHTPIAIIGAYLDGYDKGREDRPHGEWKFDGWGTYCSECGYRPKLGGGKFCSECGADMRGRC